MTTLTDLIPDVIDYLVAQCQANPALGGASPPVTIIDGPTAGGEPLATGLQLWIGFDSVTSAPEAGHASQRFAFLGASGNVRDEPDASIPCTAQAWSGDTSPHPARLLCKALVGAVEVMLRGAPSTGGPGDSSMGGLVQWSQVLDTAWTQRQDGNGYSAACVFHVGFYARLTP